MVDRLKKVLRRSKTVYRIRSGLARKNMDSEELRRLDRLEMMVRDLMAMQFKPEPYLRVETQYPVAFSSDDHKFPQGSGQDNTRSPRFVRACERIFKHKIMMADLGCSGGGLVLDFLLAGHIACGVEGSDFSGNTARAEWRLIGTHLFTADITKPFRFLSPQGERVKLDLLTAWEVLEHLDISGLQALFLNVRENLKADGLFVASVACFESADPITGAVYHRTVQPREWWMRFIDEMGFEPVTTSLKPGDFPRGAGIDWDPDSYPHNGFHLVCRPKNKA